MKQAELHNFLRRYFLANDCPIEEGVDGSLAVQLTISLDKELMNRPFYWHYLEKTGGVPNPMRLTFFTKQLEDQERPTGDFIHFGSPRLHQIFTSAKKFGGYIRLFEQVPDDVRANIPLHPWLGINVKVSYICDRKKDELYSLGLHLLTGYICENFHDYLLKQKLTPKIPDYCFTMSPLIKPASGLVRLQKFIETIITEKEVSWAEEARARWEEDLTLLNHFYEELEEKPDSFESEKQALKEQYEPRIQVSIINGGLFYLTPEKLGEIQSK